MNRSLVNIKTLARDELKADLVKTGLKSYRADQVLQWIYKKHALSFGGDDEHRDG